MEIINSRKLSNNVEVSIIIVNYNTQNLTSNCIDSIYAVEKEVSFEIIVVDNNSDNFNKDQFISRFPKVKLIEAPKNLGFAKGNNLGIKSAQGKFILLLNSDTYFTKSILKDCLITFTEKSKIGVLGVTLKYPDGANQYSVDSFPSILKELFQLIFLPLWMPLRVREKVFPKTYPGIYKTGIVDMIWGTFFMFPRSLLKDLPDNKLNDDFFMYAEDLKWCWDVKNAGYKIFFNKSLDITHLHGGSSKLSEKFFILNKKNELLFVFRNYNTFKATTIFILRQIYTALLSIKHAHFRALFKLQNTLYKTEVFK